MSYLKAVIFIALCNPFHVTGNPLSKFLPTRLNGHEKNPQLGHLRKLILPLVQRIAYSPPQIQPT